MGRVDRYPGGTFCWLDLGTTDVDGARAFYGDLLGWTFVAAGGDEPYLLARLEGLDVAGLHRHGVEEGIEWGSYVAVYDVEEMVQRVGELGGVVVRGPMEMPGVARIAVLRDPTGATLTLWQPDGHPGARLVNEVGTWCWTELTTPDLDGATAFYGGLFGWTAARAA